MGELDYVVVLAGGLSQEREISLRSGEQVCDALSEAGVQAVLADVDASLLGRLRTDPCLACLTWDRCPPPAGWRLTSRPPRRSPLPRA